MAESLRIKTIEAFPRIGPYNWCLLKLTTEEGITGRTYLFCYRPSGPRVIALLIDDAVSLIKGERIRPAEMWPYDYSRENVTPLLWFAEGVTDYYASKTLLRYYRLDGPPRLGIVVCSGKRTGPGQWSKRTVWFAKPSA